MQNFLSQQQRDDLKIQHKQERDKRICDRIKAVLLFDEGWSYQQIAHALLLSDEAMRQHLLDFQAKQKLKPENGQETIIQSTPNLDLNRSLILEKGIKKQ